MDLEKYQDNLRSLIMGAHLSLEGGTDCRVGLVSTRRKSTGEEVAVLAIFEVDKEYGGTVITPIAIMLPPLNQTLDLEDPTEDVLINPTLP